MHAETLFELTSDLRALGGGRVWSLMVSLFGDLAQGSDDQIEGPVLSSIMAALDVKPEAGRVALHRLRNDGWITSTKSGRISRHQLTPKGRNESAAASPRIYSTRTDGPENWQLVLLKAAIPDVLDAMKAAGFVQIIPRILLGPRGVQLPEGALAFPGGAAPDWLKRELAPQHLHDDYEKLHLTLRTLAAALPEPARLSALDTAVLRCLVVHNWRRLVLKHAALPRGLIDPQSPGHMSHMIVSDLLARFPRPSLQAVAQDHAAL